MSAILYSTVERRPEQQQVNGKNFCCSYRLSNDQFTSRLQRGVNTRELYLSIALLQALICGFVHWLHHRSLQSRSTSSFVRLSKFFPPHRLPRVGVQWRLQNFRKGGGCRRTFCLLFYFNPRIFDRVEYHQIF